MEEIVAIILIILIIFSVINVFYMNIYNKYGNIMYTFLIVLLALLAGLRYGTADYIGYINIFEWTPDLITTVSNNDYTYFFTMREEIGYLFLNSFVKVFTDEYIWFFFLVASISMTMYYFSIRKYAIYPMLSILLYFSMVYMVKDMAQIRQGLAIAIFAYSLRYVIENNFWKFFLCTASASLFHISIWPVLIIYPLRKIKINYYGMAFIGIICAFCFSIDIVDTILFRFFPDYDFMNRLLLYLNSEFLVDNNLNRFYKYVVLFYLLGMFNNILRMKYKLYDLMMVIFGCGLIFMAAWHEYPFFGDRFASPLWISISFLLPVMIGISNNKWYKILAVLIIVIVAVNSFINNLGLINPT